MAADYGGRLGFKGLGAPADHKDMDAVLSVVAARCGGDAAGVR
jgi:hypothetical protein